MSNFQTHDGSWRRCSASPNRLVYFPKARTVSHAPGFLAPLDLSVAKSDTFSITETPDGLLLTPFDEKISRQIEIAERIMR